MSSPISYNVAKAVGLYKALEAATNTSPLHTKSTTTAQKVFEQIKNLTGTNLDETLSKTEIRKVGKKVIVDYLKNLEGVDAAQRTKALEIIEGTRTPFNAGNVSTSPAYDSPWGYNPLYDGGVVEELIPAGNYVSAAKDASIDKKAEVQLNKLINKSKNQCLAQIGKKYYNDFLPIGDKLKMLVDPKGHLEKVGAKLEEFSKKINIPKRLRVSAFKRCQEAWGDKKRLQAVGLFAGSAVAFLAEVPGIAVKVGVRLPFTVAQSLYSLAKTSLFAIKSGTNPAVRARMMERAKELQKPATFINMGAGMIGGACGMLLSPVVWGTAPIALPIMGMSALLGLSFLLVGTAWAAVKANRRTNAQGNLSEIYGSVEKSLRIANPTDNFLKEYKHVRESFAAGFIMGLIGAKLKSISHVKKIASIPSETPHVDQPTVTVQAQLPPGGDPNPPHVAPDPVIPHEQPPAPQPPLPPAPPVNVPVDQPPVDVPVDQPPVNVPVDQPPVDVPVDQPPVDQQPSPPDSTPPAPPPPPPPAPPVDVSQPPPVTTEVPPTAPPLVYYGIDSNGINKIVNTIGFSDYRADAISGNLRVADMGVNASGYHQYQLHGAVAGDRLWTAPRGFVLRLIG